MRVRSTDEGWDDFKPAHYLGINTVDPDFDLTGDVEFNDMVDELGSLSIVEFYNVRTERIWLNGYHI